MDIMNLCGFSPECFIMCTFKSRAYMEIVDICAVSRPKASRSDAGIAAYELCENHVVFRCVLASQEGPCVRPSVGRSVGNAFFFLN